MNLQLSQRVQTVKPSPTLALTALANEMKAAGRDIVGLSAGEPDFDTPRHIKEAAVAALNKGYTRYTPVDGIPALKKAIVDKFARENQLQYTPKQILVSCGAKHSLYNAMQALLNPGDEVIIPAPYWVSYPDMVALAGGHSVIANTSLQQGFKMTPKQLDAMITNKTRMIILNSPSNPTGICYSAAELTELGAVIRERPKRIMVITDDVYEHILWTEEGFKNILNVCPDLYDRTLVVNAVSKTYAMTGWRIGYAAGPEPLIQAMNIIQSQSTSNPTSIAQYAAVAALEGDQSFIGTMVQAFRERHDFVLESLLKIEGVECLPSHGTFYIFPGFQKVMDRLGFKNDNDFGQFLIEKAEVVVVPGSSFGAPGFARISFATSMDNLKKAMQRLQKIMK